MTKKKCLKLNIFVSHLKKKSGNSAFSVPLLCEALKKDSEPDSSCSATCQKDREEGEEE